MFRTIRPPIGLEILVRTRLRALSFFLVPLFAAAACSSTDDPVTPAPTGSGSVSAADIAAKVEELLNPTPDFPMPTEAFTPGTHHVAVISLGLTSPGLLAQAQAAQDAVRALGWTAPETYDGQFNVTTQGTLIQKAVQDKVEGIVLVGIDPTTVTAAVQMAEAANIPVTCIVCGLNPPAHIPAAAYSAVLAGEAQAYYTASLAEPGATIVVYQNSQFPNSTLLAQTSAAKMKELCPSCTVDTPSLVLADASQPNAPIFTSLLRQYPAGKLDYVIMPFDTPAAALANTAQNLGRTDFGIVGLGGFGPFVSMVSTGAPVTALADVTIAAPFFGWAAVDQLARKIAGVPAWQSDQLPVGIITKENFSQFPSDANGTFLSPPGFQAKFKELWGK